MKKLPYLLTAALTFACVVEEEPATTSDETTTSDSDSDSGDGDGDGTDSDTASGDGDGDATDTDPATDTETTDTGDGDGDATDSGDGDGDTTGDPVECVDVEVTGWAADENGNLIIEDIMIGAPELPDLKRIEFYTDLAVGQVDLGSPEENNYQVCLHCVRVFEDIEGMDIARQYFQSAGTLDITELGGPGEIAATYTGLQLIEVTIGQDFLSTPVENGACLNIVDGEINTLP